MGEREIQNYLNRQYGREKESKQSPIRDVPARRTRQTQQQSTFQDFSASHLFCAKCQRAMPVKERILLYLPDGDLYEFKCTSCGSSVGTKKVGKD